MLLTGKEIEKRLGTDIIIEPYTKEQLNPNSYNLRLDRVLYVYDVKKKQEIKKSGCTFFPETPVFMEAIDAAYPNPVEELEIPDDGLILYPGILYLGKTVEYTESHNLVPCLDGRSSIGRLGINIHATAGFGDTGFCGNWTLEISCIQPVRIYPYMEICQIFYQPVLGEVTEYRGKYQGSKEILASKLYEEF